MGVSRPQVRPPQDDAGRSTGAHLRCGARCPEKAVSTAPSSQNASFRHRSALTIPIAKVGRGGAIRLPVYHQCVTGSRSQPLQRHLVPMSLPDPQRASQSFVERAGEAWVRMQERTDALIDPLGRVAVERMSVVAGERILDVGCGCGQTLFELAELAGASGHVLGVDISPPMLERACERVAGRSTIALALGDAEVHASAPRAFDAVYSTKRSSTDFRSVRRHARWPTRRRHSRRARVGPARGARALRARAAS
jgi:hypothetical protein